MTGTSSSARTNDHTKRYFIGVVGAFRLRLSTYGRGLSIWFIDLQDQQMPAIDLEVGHNGA